MILQFMVTRHTAIFFSLSHQKSTDLILSWCFFLCSKVQVDPGPEKTKHADKDENENKIKNKNCSSVTSRPQHTSKPVESSDSSNDDDEEEPTMEPEVGNMT